MRRFFCKLNTIVISIYLDLFSSVGQFKFSCYGKLKSKCDDELIDIDE